MAFERVIIIPKRFPSFSVTTFSKLIPNSAAISFACFVGLINLPREDFNPFAASAAPTPPSRIAARNTAISFTSPPSPTITGATRGIDSAKSCKLKTEEFSTIFKKLIEFANSSLESLNAL